MPNEIQPAAPQGLEELFTLEDIEKYPDLLICIDYLMLKDSEPKLNMQQIADMLSNKFPSFPTTRVGLYNRIESWRRSGTLRKAEEAYTAPKMEEYRAAIGRVITNIPAMLDRLMKDAIKGQSSKNALDITAFLMEVARESLESTQEPGDRELDYVSKAKVFNPLDISEDSQDLHKE